MNKKDNSIGGDGEECFEGCGPWSATQDYKRWKSNIKNVFEKKYIYKVTGLSTEILCWDYVCIA